jgi:putative Mg2+ transporter-C (MgtC) family protein
LVRGSGQPARDHALEPYRPYCARRTRSYLSPDVPSEPPSERIVRLYSRAVDLRDIFSSEAFAQQGDLALRLFVAAILGAAIGVERELHDHPAGMRTHLLVALGSAIFTVLSAHAFGAERLNQAVDPTRIAAQIVTGIGFLGAGAIIKEGATVRGLTTAGSLWATAAIGLAVGAREYVLAIAGTAIIVISLGPLREITRRLQPQAARPVQLRLKIATLKALDALSQQLARDDIEISGLKSTRVVDDRFEVEFDLRLPPGATLEKLIESTRGIPEVESIEAFTTVA